MTNNITPLEALEKIKEKVGQLKSLPFGGCEQAIASLEEVIDMLTQALAPQECDEGKCEYYNKYNNQCWASHRSKLTLYTECEKNPNCYYKQLHSQQKTFNDICNYGNLNTNYENCCYGNKPDKNCNDCDKNNKNKKTFTLEEVKEILEDYYGGNEKGIFPLMHEFEKEANGEK